MCEMLETELAAATKERDTFQLELTGAQSQLAEAEATMRENHATFVQLRAELESVRSGSAKVCRELRADNAKLRKALERIDIYTGWGDGSDYAQRVARAALASTEHPASH